MQLRYYTGQALGGVLGLPALAEAFVGFKWLAAILLLAKSGCSLEEIKRLTGLSEGQLGWVLTTPQWATVVKTWASGAWRRLEDIYGSVEETASIPA